jgi:hypothetical protein
MRRASRYLGLAGSLMVMIALSSFAHTNAPARVSPGDTNFMDLQNLDDSQVFEDNPQVKQLMDKMKKGGINTDKLVNERFLFASMLWGSVGAGYLLYARRQRLIVPFIAGVAMIGISYFSDSWIWMSALCIALMFAVYKLLKWGY